MLPFVTCGQMKILEKRADESGLSYYEMMENAGTAATHIICSKYSEPISQAKAIIFCGKGNNGGDGFVVARSLVAQGAVVTVVLVDGPPITKDAVTNFHLLGSSVQKIDMTKTESPFMEIKGRQTIVVDAIYGTGFRGKLKPSALKAAAFISQFKSKSLVCALDIPSGLGGDAVRESQIDTNGVKASYTITFHNKKPVHIQNFSKKYCGEIIIADIGIDEDILW